MYPSALYGRRQAGVRKAALALNGGPTDELVVTLGCQLAKPGAAELVAIHVIEVDWSHELSDELTEENEAASAVLDQAEGSPNSSRSSDRRSPPGPRSCGGARRRSDRDGADAIILGLPYRKRFGGDFAIGGTIPYVFQNAPCQVIVAREPMPSPAEVETVRPQRRFRHRGRAKRRHGAGAQAEPVSHAAEWLALEPSPGARQRPQDEEVEVELPVRAVIVGCGRVGAGLAERLARAGHDVTVVDISTDAFNRLEPDFPGQADPRRWH